MHFDYRIASDRGADFLALAPDGREVSLHVPPSLGDRPVVGDRVAVADGRVAGIAPRYGVLARARHDRGGNAQPIAANLDRVFVVTAPGRDFSPPRVERYLIAIAAAGASTLVVLNKCDLVTDPGALVAGLYGVSGETPVLPISAESGAGCDALGPYFAGGTTIALVGSSGVGKSTLANRLLGVQRFETKETRASDGRGVHTSTRRELVALPSGAWLIDTPGMRAFAPWSLDESALDDVFADVAEASARCRFRDCAHGVEPGCAVHAEVDPARFARWRQLRSELAYLGRRDDPVALSEERRRWKSITKTARSMKR